MSDDKDQKPDPSAVSETNESASAANADGSFNLKEIDQMIEAEDPNFIKQVSEIKITASGGGHSVMNEALHVASRPEVKLLDQILVPFRYSKNPKGFALFWSSVVAVGLLMVLTWGVKRNFMSQKLFLTSLGELGEGVRDYNPLDEIEDFYDNPKFSKNIMTLSKMFINIQASENSGTTPMLALEINVEGISSDAIVEIKDREAEFKDLLIRYSEERTYDDLVTSAGKQKLCDQFREIINSHLTRGQVRKVLLSSFIIKP